MSSADEVALVDTVRRANLCAGTASGAFVIVYRREIIHYVNCIVGAGLLTFTAGDTAVGTRLARYCALFVV